MTSTPSKSYHGGDYVKHISTHFEFFTPGIYDLIFLIGYFYLRLFSDDIRYIAASSSWVYSDDCF